MRIGSDNDLIAIAKRVSDPCAVSQKSTLLQAAGGTPDEPLCEQMEINPVYESCAVARKAAEAGHQRFLLYGADTCARKCTELLQKYARSPMDDVRHDASNG
jgi:hypothetical protein